MYQIS